MCYLRGEEKVHMFRYCSDVVFNILGLADFEKGRSHPPPKPPQDGPENVTNQYANCTHARYVHFSRLAKRQASKFALKCSPILFQIQSWWRFSRCSNRGADVTLYAYIYPWWLVEDM